MPYPRSIDRTRAGCRRVATALIACLCLLVAAMTAPTAQASVANAGRDMPTGAVASTGTGATSLESAATKAGETGRNVAMSLIGLALAVASIVLAFRRDFREAAAVFAVGIVCVLLASPAGESLLRDTVNALVGS